MFREWGHGGTSFVSPPPPNALKIYDLEIRGGHIGVWGRGLVES